MKLRINLRGKLENWVGSVVIKLGSSFISTTYYVCDQSGYGTAAASLCESSLTAVVLSWERYCHTGHLESSGAFLVVVIQDAAPSI